MKKALLTSAALVLLGAPLAAQNPSTVKGDPPPVRETALGCTAIPDDAYDGSLGSMACITVPGPDLLIDDVTLDVTANHTWIGDLVIKVQSPMGTLTTVLNRPAFDDVGDDGTGGFGDSSDLIQTASINFSDAGAVSAEDMGGTIDATMFVCQDDGECIFSPFAGSGPGTGMADFIGESALGDWMVCVGDAGGQDTGDICSATLNVSGTGPMNDPIIEVPTLNYVGLAALLAALGLAGAVFLRRRA